MSVWYELTRLEEELMMQQLQKTTNGLTEWKPEDTQFWEGTGKRVASRNLLVSVPALTLSLIHI